MADTPQGETVVQEPPKNDVTPVAAPAPQVNNSDNSDVEAARKETEQAKMRANQLENELKKIKEAQDKAKAQELEEQEQWKTLAEQNQAKLDEFQKEKEENETKETLRLAQDTIFAEFSPEAIEVAKEAGLSLTEDSDAAKEAFKVKLQKISDKVVSTSTVTPNNPGSVPEPNNRAELVQRMRAGDKEAQTKVISELKSLDFMRAQAGYTQNQ